MSFSNYDTTELIEYLPEALFLEDWDGKILDVNSQACELLGYSKGELLNQDVDKIVPEGNPVLLPDQIDEATRSGKPIETINIKKDGTEVPVEIRGRIIKVERKERILVSVRDITERKKREEGLRELSKDFEETLESFPGHVFRARRNEEGNFLATLSEGQIAEKFDITTEKVEGRSLSELFPEDDYSEVLDHYERAFSGEQTKFQIPLEDRWFETEIHPLGENDDGEVIEVIGHTSGITERKEREQELERTKKFLEQTQRVATVGGWEIDLRTDSRRWTDEVYRIHGLNTDFEPTVEDAIKFYHPEDQATIQDAVERATTEGEPYDLELRIVTADDEMRWVHACGEPRFEDGEIVGVRGTFQDITERKEAEEKLKESEERYRTLAENTSFGIGISKGRELIFANKKLLDIFMVDSVDRFNEKPPLYYLTPKSKEKTKERMKKLSQGVEVPENFEVDIVRTDGEQRTLELRFADITIDGKLCRLSTYNDITERKQAKRALEGERNKLRNLHDAVDNLQQQDTEEDVLDTAVDVAETMLDFEFCSIDLREGDYLVPKASATGLDPEESIPFEIGEGITGKTMQKGETIWGDDIRDHPGAKPTNPEFRAFISIPIGEIGVLQVISKEVASFEEEDVELAEILADHLREELTQVRLEKELRRQAIRDPLTGLYNRRYFNETLDKEIQQAERYDKPLAFLMIDVNRFKEINDRYSHQKGDAVLQEVANLLQENLRNADTVVRYGGDEFLIMMPETNGEATNAVDRLKEGLNRWNRESRLLDFPLTLAMGASHWSPDQERDVEEALNEADKKMYEDKRENR